MSKEDLDNLRVSNIEYSGCGCPPPSSFIKVEFDFILGFIEDKNRFKRERKGAQKRPNKQRGGSLGSWVGLGRSLKGHGSKGSERAFEGPVRASDRARRD